MELNLTIKAPKNDREWRATTGFDQARFEKLLNVFESGYQSKFGRSLAERQSECLNEASLKSYEDLLFFTLFGLKSGVTFDVLGFVFGMDVSNAQRNQVLGITVLEIGLGQSGHLPKREFENPEAFAAWFNGQTTLLLDVTEQRIQRPKNNEVQRKYYSGKKKSHR